MLEQLITLRINILSEIDGGEECRGTDSMYTDWVQQIDDVIVQMKNK